MNVAKQSIVTLRFLLPPILLVCVACPELFFDLQGLPIPLGDQLYFYPAALYFDKTGDLLNAMGNVGGDVRLVWHGWLHPVLLAKLSIGANYIGILLVEDIIVLAVCLWFFYRLQAACTASGAFLCSLAIFALLVGNNGRPEALAAVILVLWFEASGWLKDKGILWPLAQGFFLSVLAATNPNCALLVGALLVPRFLLEWSRDGLKFFKYSLVFVLSGAVFLIGICSLLYPYSIADWVLGLYENWIVVVNWRSSENAFLRYYLMDPNYPFLILWIVPILLGLFCYLQAFKRIPFLYVWVGLLVLFLLWFTFFRIPERRYYLVAFVPLSILFTVHYLNREIPRYATALFLIASLLFSTGLAFRYNKAYNSFAFGTSLEEASKRLVSLWREHGEELYLDPRLGITLLEESSERDALRRLIYDSPSDVKRYSQASILVLAQAGSGQREPVVLHDLELVENDYFTGPRGPFGLDLFNTPVSYNFAVYERTSKKLVKVSQ